MTYKIHPWPNDEPYVPTPRQIQKNTEGSIYPWGKMKPGESFFFPISDNKDTKKINSACRSLRQSARTFGIYIHTFFGFYPSQNGYFVKVVHDGYFKNMNTKD